MAQRTRWKRRTRAERRNRASQATARMRRSCAIAGHPSDLRAIDFYTRATGTLVTELYCERCGARLSVRVDVGPAQDYSAIFRLDRWQSAEDANRDLELSIARRARQ